MNYSPNDQGGPYIFISYPHQIRPQAEKVIRALQSAGYRVWFDQGLLVGSEYNEVIAERIAACEVFCCLLTSDYYQSQYCRQEFLFAKEEMKKPIIPVYIGEIAEIKSSLPYGLRMWLTGVHAMVLTTESELVRQMEMSGLIDKCKVAETAPKPAKGLPAGDEQPDEDSAVLPPDQRITLVCLDHDLTIEIAKSPCTIGASFIADYRLLHRLVSKLHAAVRVTDGRVFLMDLTSTNGTYINGEKLFPKAEYEVREGDIVSFADARFRVVKGAGVIGAANDAVNGAVSEMALGAAYPVFFAVDCSGSMMGPRMNTLNTVLKQSIAQLGFAAERREDVPLMVRVLAYSTGAKWMTPAPVRAQDYVWKNLEAGGQTDMNRAFVLLRNQLDELASCRNPRASAPAPVIVLFSDGLPSCDCTEAMDELLHSKLGKEAVKYAVTIGGIYDIDLLERFTGDIHRIFRAQDEQMLTLVMRLITAEIEKTLR